MPIWPLSKRVSSLENGNLESMLVQILVHLEYPHIVTVEQPLNTQESTTLKRKDHINGEKEGRRQPDGESA